MNPKRSSILVAVIPFAASLFGQNPVNDGATEQYLGSHLYDVSVVTRLPGGNAHQIVQVQLFLANSSPGVAYHCRVIGSPRDGQLYLADDAGDWGPNERDRYVSSAQPQNLSVQRFLRPAVYNGGALVYAGDPSEPNEWPNNSQCTLLESGSKFVFDPADPTKVTTTFRVRLKQPTAGVDIYGQWYKQVWALTENGYASSFDIFPWFPVTDATNYAPQVLHSGVETGTSDTVVRSGTDSGTGKVFFFRFRDRNGIQQLPLTWINFTAGDPNTTKDCEVRVSMLPPLFTSHCSIPMGHKRAPFPLERRPIRRWRTDVAAFTASILVSTKSPQRTPWSNLTLSSCPVGPGRKTFLAQPLTSTHGLAIRTQINSPTRSRIRTRAKPRRWARYNSAWIPLYLSVHWPTGPIPSVLPSRYAGRV